MEETLLDATPDSDTARLVTEAQYLRTQGKSEEAVSAYRRALSTQASADDKDAIRIGLANTLTRAGQTQEATRETDIVIRRSVSQPESPSAFVYGSGAVVAKVNALAQEKHRPVDDILSDLIASVPTTERPLYLYVRAGQRKGKGDISGTKSDLERIIREYPKTAWAETARDMLGSMTHPSGPGSASKGNDTT